MMHPREQQHSSSGAAKLPKTVCVGGCEGVCVCVAGEGGEERMRSRGGGEARQNWTSLAITTASYRTRRTRNNRVSQTNVCKKHDMTRTNFTNTTK